MAGTASTTARLPALQTRCSSACNPSLARRKPSRYHTIPLPCWHSEPKATGEVKSKSLFCTANQLLAASFYLIFKISQKLTSFTVRPDVAAQYPNRVVAVPGRHSPSRKVIDGYWNDRQFSESQAWKKKKATGTLKLNVTVFHCYVM